MQRIQVWLVLYCRQNAWYNTKKQPRRRDNGGKLFLCVVIEHDGSGTSDLTPSTDKASAEKDGRDWQRGAGRAKKYKNKKKIQIDLELPPEQQKQGV